MSSYEIVGAYYRPPAKVILDFLPSGCALFLVPEPDNQYDPNAIKVCVRPKLIPAHLHVELEEPLAGHGMTLQDVLDMEEIHLGYIPRKEASHLISIISPDTETPGTFGLNPQGKSIVIIQD